MIMNDYLNSFLCYIYSGYSTKCEIRNLRPDTTMTFRMRANGDPSWGTSIVAATEGKVSN